MRPQWMPWAASAGQLVPLAADAPACSRTVPAAAPVQRGDLAPVVQLPDLDGKLITLPDFRGQPTLPLFCNTGCGFCQQMLPDLKPWEEKRRRTAGGPHP